MRSIKVVLLALIAVVALGAIVAAGAFASPPEFKSPSSKSTLLFSGNSGLSTLRGKQAGQEAVIMCEKDESHGELTNNSPLAHNISIQFSGDCLQKVGGGANEICKEPIIIKTTTGELGFIEPNKLVGLYLAPTTGTEFTTVECGSFKTVVSGSIVGEFPLLFKQNAREDQYNTSRTSFELKFNAAGTKQAITAIELLGVKMTGDHLEVTGLFGEEASEETTETLTPDGSGEITT